MEEVQKVINRIKSEGATKDEILLYLDSTNILIKANAIFQIIRKQLQDEDIIDKLANLAKCLDSEPKVLGLYNNAFFALAALKWLEVETSTKRFLELVETLDPVKTSILQRLIEEKPYQYL